jgi:glycosyltransferase involved in cell wall biosynthesis
LKKILIDAKWLFEGPISGKVVIENIINQLEKDYIDKYYIILLLDSRDKKNYELYSKKGFSVLSIWGKVNLLSNMFLVPFYVFRKKVDIGIFQNYVPICSRMKTVLYIHDIIYESHSEYFTLVERLYFKPVRYCAKITDYIVTISENEKNRLIKYKYGNEGKITVIYNGVNRLQDNNKIDKLNSPFAESLTTDLPPEFILYVGRLNDRKNIYNLIKALKYVDDSLSLVIVGKKDWKNERLDTAIASESINKRVNFTGYVSDSQLIELFKKASIFAFVSFEEGFGLPPLEAMTFGLPVVVSSTSCIPEVCGDAGVYVDPNDEKSIAEGINRIYKDEQLRSKKIEAGYRQVEKFTWEKSVKNLTKLLDGIEV